MAFSLKNYAMEVQTLRGKPINWQHPPKPTTMVTWTKRTTGGKSIKGSFRTICHWDHLNRLAYRHWGVGIQIIQSCYNTGVAASAGTHDYDACGDMWIPGVDVWAAQRFFRRNGFACWVRHPPLFGWHIHGFTLPHQEGSSRSDDWAVHGYKVGVYVDGGYSTRGRLVTSSQISDYYNHAFGLSGMHTPNSDHTWYPKDIRATIFNLHAYVEKRAAAA
jgi:hypothetical protein